jgi:YVTN family beta-propeller protein
VDVREYRVIARALVGTGEEKPVGVVVSPDGRRAYTANGLTNDVSVVELSALQVSSTIRVGTRPWGVAVVR